MNGYTLNNDLKDKITELRTQVAASGAEIEGKDLMIRKINTTYEERITDLQGIINKERENVKSNEGTIESLRQSLSDTLSKADIFKDRMITLLEKNEAQNKED